MITEFLGLFEISLKIFVYLQTLHAYQPNSVGNC